MNFQDIKRLSEPSSAREATPEEFRLVKQQELSTKVRPASLEEFQAAKNSQRVGMWNPLNLIPGREIQLAGPGATPIPELNLMAQLPRLTPTPTPKATPLPKEKAQDSNYVANLLSAFGGHESRGVGGKTDVVNTITGASGIFQITQSMLDEWKRIGGNPKVTLKQLAKDPGLQHTIAADITTDLLSNRYATGIEKRLAQVNAGDKVKKEIMTSFNDPKYWIAGEWIAGPLWFNKLDNYTAYDRKGRPITKEKVRDYIKSVADRFNQTYAVDGN